ncbi:MAG: YidH family protein [Rhizobiaceae bacterium]
MAESQETKQIAMMKQVVALAEKQTDYSVQRSEMSAGRSYQNAERTLSVWVRTALSLMICGLAIDRFGLIFDGNPASEAHMAPGRALLLDRVSEWTSAALVLLGVVMVVATGLRFAAYARAWRRQHEPPPYHGPYLAPFFALMVALFGAVLLAIMATAMS